MTDSYAPRALLVYAHPEPASFCGALKSAAVEALQGAGFEVEVSDLYAEGFNPVAGRHDFKTVADPSKFHYQQEQLAAASSGMFADDIAREQGRVERADVYVFVFPIWWGGLPAILKGWFDRVMAYGFAYADGQRYDTGYFRGRRGILGITTGGTLERFSEGGAFGDMSLVLHGVQHCMLEYLGLDTGVPFVAYATPRVAPAQRQEYLVQWRGRIASLCNDPEWIEQVRRRRAAGRGARDVEPAGGWASNS